MQDNGFITSSTHFSLLQIPARSSQCRHHLNHREGSTPLLSSCKLLPVLHLHDVGLGEGSQRREGYTSPQYALTAWLQVTSQLLRNWAEGTSRSLLVFHWKNKYPTPLPHQHKLMGSCNAPCSTAFLTPFFAGPAAAVGSAEDTEQRQPAAIRASPSA